MRQTRIEYSKPTKNPPTSPLQKRNRRDTIGDRRRDQSRRITRAREEGGGGFIKEARWLQESKKEKEKGKGGERRKWFGKRLIMIIESARSVEGKRHAHTHIGERVGQGRSRREAEKSGREDGSNKERGK